MSDRLPILVLGGSDPGPDAVPPGMPADPMRFFEEDLRNLFRLQWPILTISIPYHASTAFFKYRRGTGTVADFERVVARGFLHRRHLHDAQDRPVVFSVSPIAAFAKDLDTIAEFTEVAASGTNSVAGLSNH